MAATRSINRALRLNPRRPSSILIALAYMNFAVGRTEKAVELWEWVRGAEPERILAHTPLAMIYEREGRHEEAQALVEEVLKVNPDFTADVWLEMIRGEERYFNRGEIAQMKTDLRRAGLP